MPEGEGYPLPDREWDEWEVDYDDPHEWPPAPGWPSIDEWWLP